MSQRYFAASSAVNGRFSWCGITATEPTTLNIAALKLSGRHVPGRSSEVGKCWLPDLRQRTLCKSKSSVRIDQSTDLPLP